MVDEEANVDAARAHDHVLGVDKVPSVDIDGEVAGGQTGERAMNAALELIVRRTRADRFAHGEHKQFAYAERRRKGKGR